MIKVRWQGYFGSHCKEHTGLGRNPDTSAWEPDLALIKCVILDHSFPFEPLSQVNQGNLFSNVQHSDPWTWVKDGEWTAKDPCLGSGCVCSEVDG